MEAATFEVEADAFGIVRFNDQILRASWLAAFIAWEGYELAIGTPSSNIDRFNEMIEVFFRLKQEANPCGVEMPEGVPEPGNYPGFPEYPKKQAAAEFATFAAGWVLLHGELSG